MKSKYKIKKSYRLLIAYLALIVVMGFVFWQIALLGNGNDFSFNEDILLSEKVNKFKSEFDVYVENKYISELFKSYSSNDFTIKMGEDKDSPLRYNYGKNGLEPISYDWGRILLSINVEWRL